MCSADTGLQAVISLLNRDPSNPPSVILGAGCSGVCEMVTRYAKIKKTPMASFACTSPIFSDSNEFPYFVRTSVTDEAYSNAWLAMAKANNWTRVATIGETLAISSQTIKAFEEVATLEGIEIAYHGTLAASEDPASVVASLNAIKDDVNIIFFHGYEPMGRKLFMRLHEAGLYGSDRLVLIPGWWDSNWYQESDSSSITHGQEAAILEVRATGERSETKR